MFKNLKNWAKEIKKNVLVVYFAARHKDTPLFAKLLAGLVAAYALSPIDLIPDFIPVLGYLDDVFLLPLGIALVIKMIPPDVISECKSQAEKQAQAPKSRIAAVIIVLIWLAAVCLIVLKIANII